MSDNKSNDFGVTPPTKGLTLISSYSSPSPSPSPSPPPNTDTVSFSHSPPRNADTVSFSHSPPPNTDTVSFSHSPPPNTDTVSYSQSTSSRQDNTISEDDSRDSPVNPCHAPPSDSCHAASLASPGKPVSPPSQSPNSEKLTSIGSTEHLVAVVEKGNVPISPSGTMQVEDHSTTPDNPAPTTSNVSISPSGQAEDHSTTPDNPALTTDNMPISPSGQIEDHSTTFDDSAPSTSTVPLSPSGIMQVEDHPTTPDNPSPTSDNVPISPSGQVEDHSTTPDNPAPTSDNVPISPSGQVEDHSTTPDNPSPTSDNVPISPSGQVEDHPTTPDNPAPAIDESNASDEETMEVKESGIGHTETNANLDSEIRVAAVEDTIGGVVTNTDEPMDTIGGMATNTDEPMDTIGGVATNTDEPVDTIGGVATNTDEPMDTIGGVATNTDKSMNTIGGVATNTDEFMDTIGGVFSNAGESMDTGRYSDHELVDNTGYKNETEHIRNESEQIQDEPKESLNEIENETQYEPENIQDETEQIQTEPDRIQNEPEQIQNEFKIQSETEHTCIQKESEEIQTEHEPKQIQNELKGIQNEPDGQIQDEPDGQIQDEPDGQIQNEPDGQIQDEPEQQIQNKPVEFQNKSEETADKIQVEEINPAIEDKGTDDIHDGSEPVIQAETGEIQSKNEFDETTEHCDESQSNGEIQNETNRFQTEHTNIETPSITDTSEIISIPSEQQCSVDHDDKDMTDNQRKDLEVQFTESTTIVSKTPSPEPEIKKDEVEEMVSSTNIATSTGVGAKPLGEPMSNDLKENVPSNTDNTGNTAEEHGLTGGIGEFTDLLGEGLSSSSRDNEHVQIEAPNNGNDGMDIEMNKSGMDESGMDESGIDESGMGVDKSNIDESENAGMDESKNADMDESGNAGMDESENAGMNESKNTGIDESENAGMDESTGNSCFKPQEEEEEDNNTPSVVTELETPPTTDIHPSDTGVRTSTSDPLTGQPVEVESTETVDNETESTVAMVDSPLEMESIETIDNPPTEEVGSTENIVDQPTEMESTVTMATSPTCMEMESTESAMAETTINKSDEQLPFKDGEADGYVEVRAGTGSSEGILNTGSGEEILGTGSSEEILNTGSGEEVLNAGSSEEVLNTGSGEEILNTGSSEGILNAGSREEILGTGFSDEVLNTGSSEEILNTGSSEEVLNTGSGEEVLNTGSGEEVLNTGSGEEALGAGSGEVYNRSENISVSDPTDYDTSMSDNERDTNMEDGNKLDSSTLPEQPASVDIKPDTAVVNASEVPEGSSAGRNNEEDVTTSKTTLSFGAGKSSPRDRESLSRLIEPSTGTEEVPIGEDRQVIKGPHPLEASLEKKEWSDDSNDEMVIETGYDGDGITIEKGPNAGMAIETVSDDDRMVTDKEGPDDGIAIEKEPNDDDETANERGPDDYPVPVEKISDDDRIPVEKGSDDGVPVQKMSDDDEVLIEGGSDDVTIENEPNNDGVPIEKGSDGVPIEKGSDDDKLPLEKESGVPVEKISDDDDDSISVEKGSNDDDDIPVEKGSDDDEVPIEKGSDDEDKVVSIGHITQETLRVSLQAPSSNDSVNKSSVTDEEPMETTAPMVVVNKEDPVTDQLQEKEHDEECKTTTTIRTPTLVQLITSSTVVLPAADETLTRVEDRELSLVSTSTVTLPSSTMVSLSLSGSSDKRVTSTSLTSLETSLSSMNTSSSTLIPNLPSVGTILPGMGTSLTGTNFVMPGLGTSPWLMSAGSPFMSGLPHPPVISHSLSSSGSTAPTSFLSSSQFISLLREPIKSVAVSSTLVQSVPVSTVSRVTCKSGDNDIISTSQPTPAVLESPTLPVPSQFKATSSVGITSFVSSATSTSPLSALLKHDHRPIRDRMTIISNSYGMSSETLNTGIKPIPSVLPLTSIQSTSSREGGEVTGSNTVTTGSKHKKRNTGLDKQATPHTVSALPPVIQSMPLSSGIILPPSFQPWNISSSSHVTGSEEHGNDGSTGSGKVVKTSSKSSSTGIKTVQTTSNMVTAGDGSSSSNRSSSDGSMGSSVISSTLSTLPRFSSITYPPMSLPPVLAPPPFVTPSLSSILTNKSHLKTSVPSTYDHAISSAPSPISHPTSAPSPKYSSFVPSLKTYSSALSSDHVSSSFSTASSTTTATPSSLRPLLHHSLPTGLPSLEFSSVTAGNSIIGGGVIPTNPVAMVTSQTQQLPIIRAPIVNIPTMVTLPQTEASSSVMGLAYSSITSKTSPSVIMTPSISLPPVSYIMERDSKGNSPIPGGVKQEGDSHETAASISEVDKVTANQLKLAQQKLAALQKHSYSQLSRPPDLSSFEHIGADSQGLIYWYDGGRNMYQSPKHLDNPGKLKDSEISLVCKSFVQWQNRLKQLRSSCHEADSKLAQIIKEVFLPRVKVATKRKPKDSASPQTSLVPTSTSAPPTSSTRDTTPTQFQPSSAAVSVAIPPTTSLPSSSSNLLPSTNIGPLMSQAAAAPIFVVPPNLLQSQCFPMLPVFANTAVIMPQNVSHPHSVGLETVITRNEGIIEEGSIKGEGVTIVPSVTTIGGVANSKKVNEGADEVVIERIEIHSPPLPPSGKSPASKPSLETIIKKEKLSGNISSAKNLRTPESRKDRESSPHHQSHPLLIQSFGHPGSSLPPFVLHNPLSNSKSTSTSGNISMGGVGVIQVEPEVAMGQFDPHTKSMEILGEVPIRLVTREESRDKPEGVLPRSVVSANTGSPDLVNRNDGSSDPGSRSEGMGTSLSKPSTSSGLSLSSHFKATTDVVANDSQQSHTPHEVMSAEMLLSLHDREHNSESPSVPPSVKLPHSSIPKSATPPTFTTTTTTSRGKKNRKQTPVASARVATPTISGHHGDKTPTPPVKDNNKAIEKKEDQSGNKKDKGRELFPPGANLSSNQPKPCTQDKQSRGLSSSINSGSNDTSTDSSFNITPVDASKQSKHVSTLQQTKPGGRGRGKAQRGGRAASIRGAKGPTGQRISEGRAIGLRNQKPHPPQSHDSDSESSECSSSGSESTSDISSPSPVKQSSLGGLNPSSNESEDETTTSGTDEDEEIVSTKAKGRGRGRGRSNVRGSVRLGVKRGGRAPKGKVEKLKPLRSLRTNQIKKQPESKKQAVVTTQKKKPMATTTAANKKKQQNQQQVSEPSVSTLVVKISRKLLQQAKQTTSSTGVKKKRKQPPPPPVNASEDDEDDKPFSDDDDILPPSSKHRRVSSEGPTGTTRSRRKSGHDSATDKPNSNPMLAASSNLSSFYTAQGVDLQTLSELTGNNTEPGDFTKNTSRSKRTCVRVREGITKLQEMLDTNGGTGGPTKAGSKGGSSKDTITGRLYSNPYVGKKRSRHPSATTSGRSRSRRQSEDVSSSIHQDKQASSLSRHRTKYYFSTHMVNSAADAVWRGKMDSILDYHRVQSKSKGFLSPPHKQEFVGRDSSDSSSDSEPDEEKAKPVVTRQSQSASSNRGSGRGRGRRGRRGRGVPTRAMGTRRSNRLAKVESSSEDNEDDNNSNDEDEQQSVKEEPIVTKQRGNKRKAPQPSPPPPQLTSDEATSDNDSLSDNDIHRSSPKRPRYTLHEGGTVGMAPTSPLSTPRSDESCDDSPEAGTTRQDENIAQSVGRVSGEERRDKSSPVVPNEPHQTPLSVTTPDSTPAPHPQVEEMNYTIAHSTPESTPIATDHPQIQPHPPPGTTVPRHQEYRKGDSGTSAEGSREQYHTRSDRIQPPRVHPSNAPPTNQPPELMVAGQDKSSSINMYASQGGWPHQFMQGGYPYNPKLHPMTAYHTPQGVMAGNYPYTVPYPWPHPPQSSQHIGTDQQQQQMRVGSFPHPVGSQSMGGSNWAQQGTPKPRPDHSTSTKKDSTNSKKSANSNSSPVPPYEHHQVKGGSTVTSGAPTVPPSHHPTQQHHDHVTVSQHQHHGSSGRGNTSSSNVHQYHYQTQPQPVQMEPTAAMPLQYGFDSRHAPFASAHMWQSPQHHQAAAAAAQAQLHPALMTHHLTQQGLWYAQQNPQQHGGGQVGMATMPHPPTGGVEKTRKGGPTS